MNEYFYLNNPLNHFFFKKPITTYNNKTLVEEPRKKFNFYYYKGKAFSGILMRGELKQVQPKFYKKRNFKKRNLPINLLYKSLKTLNFFKKKRLRLKSDKKLNFFFWSSKEIFSPSKFNKSYFKNSATLAFQLSKNEILANRVIVFSRSSNHLTKFELLKYLKGIFTKTTTSFLASNIHFFNLPSLSESFFKTDILSFGSKLSTKPVLSIFYKLYRNAWNSLDFVDKPPHFLTSTVKETLYFYNFLLKKNYKFKHFNKNPNMDNFSEFSSYNLKKQFSITNIMFLFFNSSIFLSKLNLYHCKGVNKVSFKFLNLSNQLSKNSNFFFYSKLNTLYRTNLNPSSNFFFKFKKKFLKLFTYDKFLVSSTPFYVNSMLRFFEYFSGKKSLLKVNTFLNNYLSYEEKAMCLSWSHRVRSFRRTLGPRLFLSESLEILLLSFKLKDPFFLSNWLVNMMKKISFWKYRLFFRYLKYVLRYFFTPIFDELNVKGIKFRLKGKISVAGNARTRTLLQRTGVTGHSTFNNKILHHLCLVRSFTGVMGLKVWIFF